MNGKNDMDNHPSTSSLSNHFLVAMPGLTDPNFIHSVIYLCSHGPEGAMGLVINHPTKIPLSHIFEQFDARDYAEDLGRQPLLAGGPVQEDRGFVLHPPAGKKWEATLAIAPDICLTSSKDIIIDMAAGLAPRKSLIVVGYAGWGAGQLESELAQNSWLTTPANSAILFEVPFKDRATAAASSIGVDMDRLSSIAGHA